MIQASRIIFIVVCAILPILIGALHTKVHFADLVTPDVREKLKTKITIMGKSQPVWYSWGIMSVMMGISFIVIGLLNAGILWILPQDSMPPLFAVIAMIVYQIAVTYVGKTFKQSAQLYGGIFGLVMNLILMAMILTGV